MLIIRESIQPESSQRYEISVFPALLILDPKTSLQMFNSIKTIKKYKKEKEN